MHGVWHLVSLYPHSHQMNTISYTKHHNQTPFIKHLTPYTSHHTLHQHHTPYTIHHTPYILHTWHHPNLVKDALHQFPEVNTNTSSYTKHHHTPYTIHETPYITLHIHSLPFIQAFTHKHTTYTDTYTDTYTHTYTL